MEKKNEGEGAWTVEIRTRRKFLAIGEACMAIFSSTPGFKVRTFVCSGFSTERTLIFVCVSSTSLPKNLKTTTQKQTNKQKTTTTKQNNYNNKQKT